MQRDLTVASSGTALACGTTDAEDRLVSADEPIAALQLRCGGELPGKIAVPALLEIVRKARRFGLKLARPVVAQDGAETITAWVEVEPRADGEAGCAIALLSWRSSPLVPLEQQELDNRRAEIDRHLAEFSARLDADQRVLVCETQAPDLAELAAAMRAGAGQSWTDFVDIQGSAHGIPLHWRLLDGVKVSVIGSARTWRASLLPQQAAIGTPQGFELGLTALEPLDREPQALLKPAREDAEERLLGREIAPVLRQPIARIIANAETIRTRLAGPLADEYAGYAGDIAAAGQHLLGLIEDLADLEVVEADDFSTEPDRLDLAEVARQAAGILGVRARDKDITVDAPRLGESLPAIAEFRRVLQVLLNLVGNAIRYSPNGSQIWVRLEGEGGRSRVIVADQGPGLSDEDQARVFIKFERLGRSGDGGSGLGLYISRRLARAMGGDLLVESAPGQGARFILELPAAPLLEHADNGAVTGPE